jgi:hypothetical protein
VCAADKPLAKRHTTTPITPPSLRGEELHRHDVSIDSTRRGDTVTDNSTGLDTSVPDPARRYDYWLGGKDNFAVDRESGDQIAARFPHIRTAVVENRRFLKRAVTALVEAGVDQFLDIGTGFPTADNTHQIVHAINPAAKVVYVDNSPLVLVHARALLTSSTPTTTSNTWSMRCRTAAGSP